MILLQIDFILDLKKKKESSHHQQKNHVQDNIQKNEKMVAQEQNEYMKNFGDIDDWSEREDPMLRSFGQMDFDNKESML